MRIFPIALSLSAIVVSACECASSGACPTNTNSRDLVFVGTVLSFKTRGVARIRVDETFSKLPFSSREVDIRSGNGGNCSFPFEVGKTYLVEAQMTSGGELWAYLCGNTREWKDSGAALRVLRFQRDGKKTPALTGRILESRRNFEGLGSYHPPKPLANVTLRVKWGNSVHRAVSDSEGIYAFYDLPSGRHAIAADLPRGLSLPAARDDAFGWDSGSSCQLRNLIASHSGSIRGRVLDPSGKPLPRASIYLAPARSERPGRYYPATQDGPGFFIFKELPPGQYVLVVNPEDSRESWFPYPRTFYPGVADRAAAGVINLGPGEEFKNADIRVALLPDRKPPKP